MTVGSAPLTYPAALLPTGFRYPGAFLALRADVAPCNLYPWFFFHPDRQTGEVLMQICRDLPGALVPFVHLS
jgi:hypothetical protein